MVEAHVLGAEVVLARAHDGGREGEGAAHGVCSMASLWDPALVVAQLLVL